LAVSAAVILEVAVPAAIGKEKGSAEQQLGALINELEAALKSRLVSVLLYGSAVTGDSQERSDLNVLCVVEQLRSKELAACTSVFEHWREKGFPAPLLLTSEEVQTSTDCFAMEFTDLSEHRRLLYGQDVIAGLQIDRSFYRAQVERELRSKLIRLRQRAADYFSQPEKLVLLMTDSLSTFCILGRHALILSGGTPLFRKSEIVSELERKLGTQWTASNAILAFRSNKKTVGDLTQNGLLPLFEQYLDEIDGLVHFVDRIDH
jgi:predicted nucleotidyltransferase